VIGSSEQIDRENAAALPDYPAELVREVECADSMRFRIRPIRPDDGARLESFHRHLSKQSVYLRFFSYHPVLSPKEVERFTTVDYRNRMALIVECDTELVAVGRFDRTPDSAEAEVAFVVADEYQHHGIATLLLDELARTALERGITAFTASTLAENRTMLAVFFNSGFHVTSSRYSETITLEFSIAPGDEYRAALAAREATRRYVYPGGHSTATEAGGC
jgi:GNAT superfamily N-acetyltransferase